MDAIQKIAAEDGMKIIAGIVTHNHFDHVGGRPPYPYDKFGISVQGIRKLASDNKNFMVYIGKEDYQQFIDGQGDMQSVIPVVDNQEISIGSQKIKFIATPGHTPGSISVLLNDSRLFTGDTLFYNSCGRVDMEGGNYEKMYDSLQKLARFPDSLLVYTGHNYGKGKTFIEREKKLGMLQEVSFDQWRRLMSENTNKLNGD